MGRVAQLVERVISILLLVRSSSEVAGSSGIIDKVFGSIPNSSTCFPALEAVLFGSRVDVEMRWGVGRWEAWRASTGGGRGARLKFPLSVLRLNPSARHLVSTVSCTVQLVVDAKHKLSLSDHELGERRSPGILSPRDVHMPSRAGAYMILVPHLRRTTSHGRSKPPRARLSRKRRDFCLLNSRRPRIARAWRYRSH